jgi:mRNA interferase RelE/StbE
MGVIFKIRYHEAVAGEDIPRLSSEWKKRIKTAIEARLSSFPDLYGKPLRRSLKGYRKLRVGDYRVIFRIEEQTVKIFIIEHRSAVYRNAEGRLLP